MWIKKRRSSWERRDGKDAVEGLGELDLIDPAGITTGTAVPVLDIGPTQGMSASRDVVGLLLPTYGPADLGLLGAVDTEAQVVGIGLGRHHPPETQGAGTGNTGLHPGLLIVADGPALGGIGTVMGGGCLPCPDRVAAAGPVQTRIVHGIGERVF